MNRGVTIAGWVVLFPLSCLWALAMRIRRGLGPFRRKFRTRVKTVVVGNIHSGGSGKTPIVAAIADRFCSKSPVIVSRGYRGRQSRSGAKIDLCRADGPQAYGDEPWMLAQRLGVPVYIGANRARALQQAERETQPGFFLLDDAFQNQSFEQDIRLVAIQTKYALSDTYCLPLGPLREPLGALHRASAVLLVGESDGYEAWKKAIEPFFAGPCFPVKPVSDGIWGEHGPVAPDAGTWGAFCGIALPSSFEKSLQAIFKTHFFIAYSDHHSYGVADRDALLKKKAATGVSHLITTEKDWYKVLPLFQAVQEPLYYLRIHYEFPEAFWSFLGEQLEGV